MLRKTCFRLVWGAGVVILIAGIVHGIPLEQLEQDEERVGEATTPGWGSGWNAEISSGETAAYGQTQIIEHLAGSNTQENPSILEGSSESDIGSFTMSVQNYQQSDLQADTNSWVDGGGYAGIPAATAVSDGPYNQMNQGGLINTSVTIGGVNHGGIISNPQTSAGLSAGVVLLSSSGQVTNGTNVNPGAGGWGSGWGNEGSGWRVTNSGWSAPQEGSTASASTLEVIQNLSQQANAQDNITAIAIGNEVDPVSLDATISAPIAVEAGFNGNGVDVANADESIYAGTQWTNFDISSYPQNNATFSVDAADNVAISAQPNSTTTLSFGQVTVSDWATMNNGSNLVNQNSGGWGSPGWGQPAQGWGVPAPGRS